MGKDMLHVAGTEGILRRGTGRGHLSSHHVLGRSGLEVVEPGERWSASETDHVLEHITRGGKISVKNHGRIYMWNV